MTSSIFPLPVVLATRGVVSSVAVVLGGTGYTNGQTVNLLSTNAGNATGTATVVAGAVTAVAIVLGGSGYINGETVNILGGNNDATGTIVASFYQSGFSILDNNIVISNDLVKPGGGGIVRMSFALSLATPNATISVRNNGALKGNLNADNSAIIISEGYYRFDIDVEDGDSINFISTEDINKIRFFRAHLVQFGA